MIAKEVANSTTMSKADIVGVLTALSEVITSRLSIGRSIDLLDWSVNYNGFF
jgi:hypothetical protein